jgi:AraC-like DNA-binding protein
MYKELKPSFTHRKSWVHLSVSSPLCVYEYDFTQSDKLLPNPVATETLSVETQGAYCRMVNRGPRTLPHDQEFYEITFHLEGVSTHYTEDYRRLITPGSVLIVTPGMVHGYDFEPGAHTRTKNVYFIPEWLISDLRTFWKEEGLMPLILSRLLFRKPLHAEMPQFTITPEEMRQCEREIDDIREESSRDHPSLFVLKMTLLKLLVRVCRAYAEKAGPAAFLPYNGTVIQALELIETVLSQGAALDTPDLARQLGITPEHLSRSLKKATGWSPMEYYQHRRIQCACHELLDPGMSVTEVAQSLGFFDAPHFNRIFRKYQGISPTQYRERYAERG